MALTMAAAQSNSDDVELHGAGAPKDSLTLAPAVRERLMGCGNSRLWHGLRRERDVVASIVVNALVSRAIMWMARLHTIGKRAETTMFPQQRRFCTMRIGGVV
jgi:hypothetical protein